MSRKLRTIIIVLLTFGFIFVINTWHSAQSAPATHRYDPEYRDKLSSIVLIDPTQAGLPSTPSSVVPHAFPYFPYNLGDVPTGPNVLSNQDETTKAQNETSIDVNPTDPNHIVVTSNDYRLRVNPPPAGDVRAGYYVSFDGGNTWPGDGVIDISSIPNTFAAGDPAIAIHDVNNVYFAFIAFNRDTDNAGGVVVSKSTDGGLTWQDPVMVYTNINNGFQDKDYLAVDATGSPYDGNVYVSWTHFYTGQIYLSRSTDGGATYSNPIAINGSYSSNQGSIPVVGPDGTLYVAWLNSDYPSRVVMAKSTDGGQSFSAPFAVATVYELPYNLPGGDFRTDSFPTAAVDPTNGNIYVAWGDMRNGDADIYFTRSTNGGSTWSTPVRINDDQMENNAHQFFPWLDVAPNGKIYASWYDSRNDPTPLTAPLLYDEFAASSTDGGVTFSPNQRISEVTSDSSVGGFTTPFIGDYSGVAATNDFVYPAWVDTRRDQEDIFIQRLLFVEGQKVAPNWLEPLQPFTYSIYLHSSSDVLGNQLNDPLPVGATYIPGSAYASSGEVDFAAGAITWNGDISATASITITFGVTPTAEACLPINNEAVLTTGQGLDLTFSATSVVTGTPPVPEFSWVTSQLVFTFTNETSSTIPIDYVWNFGDGITSTEQSPVHEYAKPGSYAVSLGASDLCGSNVVSHPVVAACSAPQAGFTSQVTDLTAAFTNSSSGRFSLSFLWDFGDGITSTLSSPVHDYSLPATFDVSLAATDLCGTGSFTGQVTTTCNAPSAGFSWQSDNLMVSFTNLSGGTQPLSYSWDFGDGASSTEKSPSHVYSSPGRYTVLLTVTAPCGEAQFRSIVQAGSYIFLPLAVR